VDKAAALVEARKAKVSPYYHDKLDALLDRYARRLAQWTNDYNRNQASYPSQFISGAGGYNMKKHNRQMAREGDLWKEYDEIKAILNKIEAVGTGAVDLPDPHAREMLADQLQKLQAQLDRNKAMNAYYRKHKSFVGFPGLTAEAAAKLTAGQCALIAATLPNPIRFDSAHPSSYILKRQGQILRLMKLVPKFPPEEPTGSKKKKK
jgi:hypothetical protein